MEAGGGASGTSVRANQLGRDREVLAVGVPLVRSRALAGAWTSLLKRAKSSNRGSMAGLVVVTDANFDREVIRSTVPVVVDFTAEWCAPCRITEPALRELSQKLVGRVKFAKVDVDDADVVTRTYGIHSIPTYLFVEEGKEKGREIGPVAPAEFRSVLKKYFDFA